MITNFTRPLALVFTLGLVTATGACNRDADVDTDTSVPPATETTPPAASLRVSNLELGSSIGADNKINDNAEKDEFKPADTIYATVETDGSGTGTMVARWTFQDGQVVDETTRSVSPTGPTVTEFHIAKPGGFPVGKYKVEILLNGQTTQSKDFEVK
jgi:hypothetical protein